MKYHLTLKQRTLIHTFIQRFESMGLFGTYVSGYEELVDKSEILTILNSIIREGRYDEREQNLLLHLRRMYVRRENPFKHRPPNDI